MSRHPFDLLMELDTDLIRLDCAALHLARDAYPLLTLAGSLRVLDRMAQSVARARAGCSVTARYEALRRVLVKEYHLTGNQDDYYDPANSYLNRVLEMRRGIPISLAIVWIEVGRRLKWPVGGVALPGHFIVRLDDPEQFVLADPFHGGRTLTVRECASLVRDGFDGRISFSTEQLEPVDTRTILLRLLRNLRNIYLAQNDLPRVQTILRRMAALEPSNGRHIQDIAAVCCRRGDVRGACAHLELYLRRAPDGPDSQLVRRNLRQLHAALLARN